MAHLTRINITHEGRGPHPWEYSHTETWKADGEITDADIETLRKNQYGSFPVVHVSFEIDRDLNLIIAHVVEDNCN